MRPVFYDVPEFIEFGVMEPTFSRSLSIYNNKFVINSSPFSTRSMIFIRLVKTLLDIVGGEGDVTVKKGKVFIRRGNDYTIRISVVGFDAYTVTITFEGNFNKIKDTMIKFNKSLGLDSGEKMLSKIGEVVKCSRADTIKLSLLASDTIKNGYLQLVAIELSKNGVTLLSDNNSYITIFGVRPECAKMFCEEIAQIASDIPTAYEELYWLARHHDVEPYIEVESVEFEYEPEFEWVENVNVVGFGKGNTMVVVNFAESLNNTEDNVTQILSKVARIVGDLSPRLTKKRVKVEFHTDSIIDPIPYISSLPDGSEIAVTENDLWFYYHGLSVQVSDDVISIKTNNTTNLSIKELTEAIRALELLGFQPVTERIKELLLLYHALGQRLSKFEYESWADGKEAIFLRGDGFNVRYWFDSSDPITEVVKKVINVESESISTVVRVSLREGFDAKLLNNYGVYSLSDYPERKVYSHVVVSYDSKVKVRPLALLVELSNQ